MSLKTQGRPWKASKWWCSPAFVFLFNGRGACYRALANCLCLFAFSDQGKTITSTLRLVSKKLQKLKTPSKVSYEKPPGAEKRQTVLHLKYFPVIFFHRRWRFKWGEWRSQHKCRCLWQWHRGTQRGADCKSSGRLSEGGRQQQGPPWPGESHARHSTGRIKERHPKRHWEEC